MDLRGESSPIFPSLRDFGVVLVVITNPGIEIVGRLHQQQTGAASGRVDDIVMAAERMIDAFAHATAGAPLQRGELTDEAWMVQQRDFAGAVLKLEFGF